MVKIVDVLPSNDRVVCEAGGSGVAKFAITNSTSRPVRVGARVVAEGSTPSAWFTLERGPEWSLDKGATDEVTVRVQVPKEAAAGEHKFHLVVFSTDNPDEDYTDSGTVALAVTAKPVVTPEPKKFPFWIIPVVVVVLIALGIGAWFLLRPGSVAVPDVTNQPLAAAQEQLVKAGFAVGAITQQPTAEVQPDVVLAQSPKAGEKTGKNAAIDLIVAVKAPPSEVSTEVPDVIDISAEIAKQKILAKGLTVGTLTDRETRDRSPGLVLEQDPRPGERKAAGTAVNLIVSAKVLSPVPEVVDVVLDTAKKRITDQGFTVGAIAEKRTGERPPGVVLEQAPRAGEKKAPGTAINLTVSKSSSEDVPPRHAEACIPGYTWREAFPGDHVCVTPEVYAQTAADNGQAESRFARNNLPYGANTCVQGYVWREAFAGDYVCVTPAVRAQAAADNAQAQARYARNHGVTTLPYGPDTCVQGYVWREVRPNDHVCVTPTVRAQAAADNAQAQARYARNNLPYGPDTCVQGYVWREARPNDHVCVTPAVRAQAAADNAQAQARYNK